MKLKNIKIQFFLGANINQKENLKSISMADLVLATQIGACDQYNFKKSSDNIKSIISSCPADKPIPKEFKDKIKTQKKYYPFITPSIYGTNGSKMSGYTFNGLSSFDADISDNPKLLNKEYHLIIKNKLISISNMVYVATSPSGGVKMMMYISLFQNENDYKNAYSLMLKFIESSTGLKLDKATSAPNQNMFIPYDPEVLFNNEKELLNREELFELSRQVINTPQKNESDSENEAERSIPDLEYNLAKTEYYVNQLMNQDIDVTATYPEYLGHAFSFASLGEQARTVWLKLCSIHPNYNQEDCDAKFTHCLKKYDGRKTIGSFFWECESKFQLQRYNNTTINTSENLLSINPEENLQGFNSDNESKHEIDDSKYLSPFLFNDIVDKLPVILQEIMQPYSSPRQKDIIGLTLLNSISGINGNIKVAHRNKFCNTNTCAVIVAPPGAGKGITTEARSIMNILDEFQYQESLKEISMWKEEEKENSKFLEPPMARRFLMPLDSTSASFTNFLLASKGTGAVIETEMGIGKNFSNQWESTKQFLLKNFHNEDIDVNRKSTGLKRVPLHFGYTLTTTPATALSMITHSDGLLSRIVIYNFNEHTDFDDCTFDFNKAFETNSYIEKIGNYVKDIYVKTIDRPIMNYGWTMDSQKKLLYFFRSVRNNSLMIFGEDIDALIKRAALTASRYGAIFAFLDDFEADNLSNDSNIIRMIPDKYADTVITLANRILWHARTFYDNIEIQEKTINSIRNNIYYILRFLPTEFKLGDVEKDIILKSGLSKKTLERRLNECLGKGFLEKIKHGHYRKTDKCPIL